MATVVKNFRIKQGLVVEGSTGTINGQNILTETGSDQYILDLIGGVNLIDSVSSDFTIVGAELQIASGSDLARTGDITSAISTAAANYDAAGAAATAQSNAEDYADGLASNYDAAGAAATAQSNAEDYADGLAANYDAAGAAATVAGNLSTHESDTAAHGATGAVVGTTNTQTLTNKTIGDTLNFTGAGAMTINSDSHIVLTPAAGSSVKWGADVLATQAYADQAETDAKAYTDTELASYTPTASLDTTIDGYGYLKSADLSGYATETFVGTAIDNLVDGAPGLLDTLNEIAAAIADDANYATTMTTALAAKQDELTAGSNISIVADTISVTGLDSADISDFNTAALSATSAAYDAAGAAATAQSNAEDYADGLASNYDAAGAAATAQSNAEDYADGLAANYDAAGTASGLVNNLKDATTAFTAINVNSVAKQVAATTGNIVTAAQTTAISWAAADYRSAKFIVKAKNGVHTQVSDLVVTLDTANNVAVSEYGITYSNGTELAAVTADYSGSDVRIRVTPANNNTEVVVVGTLIK